MKPLIYLFLCTVFLMALGHQTINAKQFAYEEGISIGADISGNIPTGDAGDEFKTSIGFNARLNYFLVRQIAIGISLGYLNWGFKNAGTGDFTFYMIPILATFQYYLIMEASLRLYIGLGAGPWLLHDKFSFQGFEQSNSETKYGIKPMIGVMFPLAAAIMLNASLSYPIIFTDNKNFTYLRVALGIMYSLQ